MAVYTRSHIQVLEEIDDGIPVGPEHSKRWVEEKCNIAPDDVVLLVDPGNPRGHWPLDQIQEVFPGPDGKVRVVRVRTGGKDYVRPITKLCPLEI